MKYCLDVHCHTVSSGHAYSTLKEYVEEAVNKKLELIAITDHAPLLLGAPSYLYFLNLKVIPPVINGIEVLRGVELNISNINGDVDLPESILKSLDVVIASIHLPCFPPSDEKTHTNAVINTMKNKYVKIIGHLGDPRYPMDFKEVVKVAKENGIAIEINNASFFPGSTRSGGADMIYELAYLCKEYEVPVILSSDAHIYLDIGNFTHIIPVVEKVNFPENLVLNSSKELFKKHIGII